MEQRGSGDERLAAICQKIRNETLEPAKQDAEIIRINAERQAVKIKEEARQQADKLLHEARKAIAEEKTAFEATLQQTCRQTIDLLRQQVERSLFKPALDEWLSREFSSEEKTAQLIDVLIEFLKKEGFEGDLSAWIGSHLSKEKVVQSLAQASLNTLPKEGLQISDQAYGVLLKIVNKHLTLEVTPEAIKELMANFIRSEFRRFLFNE